MTGWNALRRVWASYTDALWRERLHVVGRLALCPFGRLASFVPQRGLIVDLGCGHGVFANMLASPGRRIVGVEPSAGKLAVARIARSAMGDVQFVQGDAVHNPVVGPCRVVLIVDVLYLLTYEQQEQVLRTCFERLEPGGVLLLKTMDDRPRWKAVLNRLEEWLAVWVLHITLSRERGFAFRSLVEWAALCQAIGFETQVLRLHRGYYHPHGAVIGIKR
ncbi:MAG: class I SAM-dependent methyltransferase [Anaerolineae bacterium]